MKKEILKQVKMEIETNGITKVKHIQIDNTSDFTIKGSFISESGNEYTYEAFIRLVSGLEFKVYLLEIKRK